MQILFLIMAVITLGAGLLVVALRNPLHSALALIINLLGVAALYAMLEAHFLAAVQVIIYAGAIVVLVVFVLMLINVKFEALKKGDLTIAALGLLIGLVFAVSTAPVLLTAFSALPAAPATAALGNVENIGQTLFSRYLLPFQLSGLLLLSSLVGAVMLSKRKRRDR